MTDEQRPVKPSARFDIGANLASVLVMGMIAVVICFAVWCVTR